MTHTTDLSVLMLKMRTLADRIIDAEGENNNGEVGKIIDMYDAADTTFKAQNILLVLNAFEAERQRADANEPVRCEGVPQHVHDMIDMQETIDELRAEIAELKSDQVPVYQMYYDGFWRDVDKEHYEHFKIKGSEVRELFTALQLPVVPESWQLVPKEPTHEMLDAGAESFGTYDVYRDMLSAAPKPGIVSTSDHRLMQDMSGIVKDGE